MFWAAMVLAAFLAWGNNFGVQAQSVENLEQEIEAKNEEIKKLEEEAERYRKELETTQERGETLQAELKRIDRTIRKLRQDITVTEARIGKARIEITRLTADIQEKERAVSTLQGGLGGIMQTLYEREKQPLIAALIQNKFLSDFFRQFDYFTQTKKRMLESVNELRAIREALAAKITEEEIAKEKAENLRRLLGSQRSIVDQERKERDFLLQTTKNQEKEYQALLKEREEKKRALESEIREIENQIRFTLDPSSLPSKGVGVLGWPLANTILESCWTGNTKTKEDTHCITQYFGYTDFARIGGYSGRGHNGTDFRAAPGDEVFAAENGIVKAMGDTDLGCRGASYGKWILIEHPNNLSTLYAHLSHIGVSKGTGVSRGERIGLSGATGYATGPHLHFTVFAAQAVRIESIRSRVCGRLMTLPLSAPEGYLDPLDYL